MGRTGPGTVRDDAMKAGPAGVGRISVKVADVVGCLWVFHHVGFLFWPPLGQPKTWNVSARPRRQRGTAPRGVHHLEACHATTNRSPPPRLRRSPWNQRSCSHASPLLGCVLHRRSSPRPGGSALCPFATYIEAGIVVTQLLDCSAMTAGSGLPPPTRLPPCVSAPRRAIARPCVRP